MTKEKLVKKLTEMKTMAVASVDEFKEKLSADPFNAFEWGMDALHKAAEIQVADYILSAPNATVEQVRDQLRRDVLHRSMYPSRSTSPLHNLMEQELLGVMATVLRMVEDK